MEKSFDENTKVSTISFKPDTNYQFLFKDSEFIGVLVETSDERKSYYLDSEDDETKLTDNILKSALQSFAEIDFEGFEKIVILFLSVKKELYALAQEVVREKIKQLSNSMILE